MDAHRPDADTLVRLLRRHSAAAGDRLAVCYLRDGEETEARLTYGRLDERARAIAARLQRLARLGDRALLLFPPGPEFVEAFVGCLYAGVVAVPAYPPDPSRPERSRRILDGILSSASPAAILTTAAGAELLRQTRQPLPAGAAMLLTESCSTADAARWREPALDEDSLAFLQYTSGSTSSPKGVMVSHANLLANEAMIQRALGPRLEAGPNGGVDVTLGGWLPLYHDMGLIGLLLRALYLGTSCVLIAPEQFLQSPLRWLRMISTHRLTTSGGPNFAYELCVRRLRSEDCEGLDLSAWSVAFNGAEPIRSTTIDDFSAAFAPYGFRPEAFLPCYGLAEGTLLCSGGPSVRRATALRISRSALERNRLADAQRDDPDAVTLAGCGAPAEGIEMAVVDPETGVLCPPGEVGEIWVAGPNVANGYWGHEEASRGTFAAALDDGDHRFLRTGDLGALRDGELFVAGRLKDLIVVDGRNVHPSDVELTVEASHPGVRKGCSAAFAVDTDEGDGVVVAVEVRGGGQDDGKIEAAIRAAVSRAHGVALHAISLLPAGSVPKTSSGKVQRHRARLVYLQAAERLAA